MNPGQSSLAGFVRRDSELRRLEEHFSYSDVFVPILLASAGYRTFVLLNVVFGVLWIESMNRMTFMAAMLITVTAAPATEEPDWKAAYEKANASAAAWKARAEKLDAENRRAREMLIKLLQDVRGLEPGLDE